MQDKELLPIVYPLDVKQAIRLLEVATNEIRNYGGFKNEGCKYIQSIRRYIGSLSSTCGKGYRELEEAVAEHGSFGLVLSGGSIVDILASTDLFTTNCDSTCAFELWHIFLADERCVPISDEESTFGRMQRLFVIKNTNTASVLMQKAQFVTPFTFGTTAGDAAASYERIIGNEPMDLFILGVGTDGHTASIFPKVSCEMMLHDERIIIPVLDSPKAPLERITFSLNALKTLSRSVVVIASGASKASIIRSIFSDRCKDYPLTHIDRVEYFLDQLAASLLA